MNQEYKFKILDLADLEAIVAIEQSTQLVPWTQAMIEQHLGGQELAVGLIFGQQLLAYCFCMLIAPEAEILTICVSKTHQQQGLGKLLLSEVLRLLQAKLIHTVFLEVRAGNQPALALYNGIGFRQIGLRKNYYTTLTTQREDALILKLEIK